jgi:aryl-alcohol dehydrogenase-like predicted oxidoreductase
MEMRRLGRTELNIAPFVFGGNVFGWTANEQTSFALLDRFVGAGLNAIDTADVYSSWAPGNTGGESETIIGNWLKSRRTRNKVILATKVGFELGPEKKGLSARYIEAAVEASLRRLQTDVIDLYQSHLPDPSVTHEETLSAYAQLIQKGKVRYIGASNYSAAQLRDSLVVAKAKHVPRYETVQPEYNLFDRSAFDAPLCELCIEEQIGVITYFSLAKGFLTGKYRHESDLAQSPRGAGIKDYLNARGNRILAALDRISEAHNAKPAEVALAWLIAHRGVTAPIASATSLTQLDSLVRATSLKLTKEDINALEDASRLDQS